MILVDLIIVVALIYGAYAGYRKGFISVGYGLGVMIVSLVVAALIYGPMAKLMVQKGGVVPSFAAVLSIGIITMLCILLASFTAGNQLRRVPDSVKRSDWNMWLGAAVNVLRTFILIVLALIVAIALPFGASSKRHITESVITSRALPIIAPVQRVFNQRFGATISDAINFFTVDPAGQEKIDLGFKTTNVTVDEADEELLLAYINRERTTRGLQPLQSNPAAREVARAHSREMFALGYFSHIDAGGGDAYARIRAANIKFSIVGENLAVAPTADQAHLGLMDSPGHRANIVSTEYKSVGIGVVDGGPYGLMITEDFLD